MRHEVSKPRATEQLQHLEPFIFLFLMTRLPCSLSSLSINQVRLVYNDKIWFLYAFSLLAKAITNVNLYVSAELQRQYIEWINDPDSEKTEIASDFENIHYWSVYVCLEVLWLGGISLHLEKPQVFYGSLECTAF